MSMVGMAVFLFMQWYYAHILPNHETVDTLE